ncbi:uncharacterized protein LOC111711216 [Eurytemora carolleeae]|uniref:uncharacterized protein LOC111711216 n=1 Tax=Eurytemora carolleeae TaxID=1294199 RepID=UPI000C77CC57|nr:uncharacterized protein LOC111711216 [Eurytemora carolleeae]|eukprot:XP_023341273.1 uncharacterized protein LOC111711216 [Eurytemora affinis]
MLLRLALLTDTHICRPVNRPKEVFSSLRLNSDGPQRFALAGQTFGPYQREAQSIIGNRRFELPGKPTQLEFEAPAKPESQATNKEQRFSSNLEQETRRSDSNVAERFYNSKEQDKVYERSAQQDTGSDLLEGESFQPAYTPYSPPAAAYDAGYAPPEQKSIQDAVAAGAAAYNGAAYEEPKRLSFQIHGQEGPNSYRFGYDTGEGYNRQFRYEERDNYGVLHGRYGYYDQEGKLQIVNYTADPEAGFHAEGDHVPKPEY